MTSTPHSERASRRKSRGIFRSAFFAAACGALTLLFLLQAVFLCRGEWNVPDVVLSQMHEELADRGWRASYHSVAFRPPGSVFVRDLRLTRDGDDEPSVSADVGRIDFALLDLLRGELMLEEVTLYGGTIYCPALYSPTGMRERVVEQAHLVARQDTDGWSLHNLNGKIQNLGLTASGAFPALLPARREEAIDWERIWEDLLPRLVLERDQFERVETPRLHLHFAPTSGGGLAVQAKAWAEAVNPPREVRVTQPTLTTAWVFDGSRWEGEAVSFEAASAIWRDEVTASGLAGQVLWPINENGAGFIPDQLDLSVARIETEAGSLTDLQLRLARGLSESIVAADFFALFFDDPLEGSANLDWRQGTGDVEIISRVNPTPVLQHEIAREFGLRRDLFFHEAPFVRASARVKDWRLVGASGRALARHADIDGVFMHRASARAEFFPDRLVVPELVLAYQDFEVEGAYEFHLDTQAYRFLFKGGVRPLHISAWFQDWWATLWNEFDFARGPLQGDVDIHGILFQPETIKLTGAVGAEDFFVRGVPIQALDARLLVLEHYANLFEIELFRSEGAATGSFQYRADPESAGFASMHFDARSTVNPTEVGPIFGEEGKEILSAFRFTQPPVLSLKGVVYGSPRKSETRVTLSGEAAAPMKYRGLGIDHLVVEAIIDGDDWNLSRITAGLAGGNVTGNARKWLKDEDEHLEFSFRMQDLDLAATLENISGWQAENGVEENGARLDQKLTGVVDGDVEASGRFGDIQSFSGGGSVQIREADLAQVHLLGLLSRVLSVTPLGFTSLHFNEAETSFLLDRKTIQFPKIRLTGPTSSIQSSGNYRIDQDALDFSVKLHFLKESKVPFLSLLLSPVLKPLAHVTEIRLTGTSADPQWRFLLGPRNILSGASSVDAEDEADEEGEDAPERPEGRSGAGPEKGI